MRGIGSPNEYRFLSPAPMKGGDFSMHSATKFKYNFAVIGVVLSGIWMAGSYLVSLEEMKSVVIPYINIRVIQRPILCHNRHRW